MLTNKPEGKICVIDYYLDGYYLEWKECDQEGFPEIGTSKQVQSEAGVEIEAKVVEIHEVSECEYKILLVS